MVAWDNASLAGSTKSYRSSRSAISKGSTKTKRKQSAVREAPIEPAKEQFSHEHVRNGLSQLGKTASGVLPAYLQLTISGTDLEDASALRSYPHLQTISLPDNKLKDVRSLGCMHNLTSLNVSGNQLTQVLDLELDGKDSQLRHADFSRNQVMIIRDLSPFSRLQSLNLDCNQIERVTCLQGLLMLKSLSLAHNKLHTCQGLHELPAVRELDLTGNLLSSLSPLSTLRALELLTATHNKLVTLGGLEELKRLRRLDISHNQLARLEEVACVRDAALLSVLVMHGNPVDRAHNVRLHVVSLLPQVTVLDGQPVSAKEKVLAANMHGADADGQRAIRRKYFPNGELDDGGGAIPPTSAGLIASCAEEECAGDCSQSFIRIDAWARSLQPASALTSGGGLIALADQLASVCTGQLERARAVYEWVVQHILPPRHKNDLWDVHVHLFGHEAGGVESVLLGGMTGTWAERVSRLFVQLARACELEAVMISGYWKHDAILPGQVVHAHNHCWCAVKVNGCWRLIDCAAAAHAGGHLPFYNPPEAFVYSHWPLEASWQLLHDPISLERWWDLPACSIEFFARGCRLLDDSLQSVNVMPAIREGQAFPAIMIPLAAPTLAGEVLSHRLLNSQLQPVSAWPHEDADVSAADCASSSSGEAWLTFQQFSHGPKGSSNLHDVRFGSQTYSSAARQLWTSLPGPGDWYVEVELVRDVPGGLTLAVAGGSPLRLHLVERHTVMRVKVVVPPIKQHDVAADGILHDPRTHIRPLPYTHPTFTASQSQMVSPLPGSPLEADGLESVKVIVRGAQRVALLTPHDDQLTELNSITGEQDSFSASVQVPRASQCCLVAQLQDTQGKWTRLATLQILPQCQHVVECEVVNDVMEVDPDDPVMKTARDMFRALDRDRDGLVSRHEMLAAFRQNRQLADILRFPAKIRGGDGTLEQFFETFLQIDGSKLGHFTFNELVGYMGLQPSHDVFDSEDDDDDSGSVYEDEEEGDGDELLAESGDLLDSKVQSRAQTPMT